MLWCSQEGRARDDHNPDTNCPSLLDVMGSGIPNRDTHELRQEDEQDVAVSSSIGIASDHQVERSVTVKRYRNLIDAGRGTTIPTWMCENLRCGCGKSRRAVFVYRCI